MKASNVLFGFCLGIEGGDLGVFAARDLFDWRQTAEDEVLSTFLDSDIGNRLATVVLDVQGVGAEGRCCHGKDGVYASQSFLEGSPVEHVPLDDFDLLFELLGLLRVDITGDGTDLVLLGEL